MSGLLLKWYNSQTKHIEVVQQPNQTLHFLLQLTETRSTSFSCLCLCQFLSLNLCTSLASLHKQASKTGLFCFICRLSQRSLSLLPLLLIRLSFYHRHCHLPFSSFWDSFSFLRSNSFTSDFKLTSLHHYAALSSQYLLLFWLSLTNTETSRLVVHHCCLWKTVVHPSEIVL